MNNKRSGKFYRQNEKEVMKSLGLKPTYNSGSGWIEKEDGENEFILCQLKSTDAMSISINQKDWKILEENALVTHKVPVFVIQFLNENDVYVMCKPEDLRVMAEYIDTGKIKEEKESLKGMNLKDNYKRPKEKAKKIKSSEDARNEFFKNREENFKRRK